ncbi:MAG: SIS domain-containing protein [Spirochaetaceae bacterium]|nr:MAG: SIS domain-containing protein [Spirochaetaceae bacterium]
MNDGNKTPFSALYEHRPELLQCQPTLSAAFGALCETFQSGHKLMICGNGGSAADCEHIVGELMKGFRRTRSIPGALVGKFDQVYGPEGKEIAELLQGAFPAVSLVSHISLSTAIANDLSADMVFAQQVYGYGKAGDALLAISTSGNAKNVINAVKVARVLDIRTVALTGERGTLKELAEISISVPGNDTARIQEYHMAIYHALCAALETEFFSE